jgi:hypothetical protein
MNATNLNEWKARLADEQLRDEALQEIVKRLPATSLERLDDFEEFDRIGQLIAAARMAFPNAARGQ